VVRLSSFRELECTYQQKFTYYEALVEDIMAENTRLILDQERIRELECERDFLQETLKEF